MLLCHVLLLRTVDQTCVQCTQLIYNFSCNLIRYTVYRKPEKKITILEFCLFFFLSFSFINTHSHNFFFHSLACFPYLLVVSAPLCPCVWCLCSWVDVWTGSVWAGVALCPSFTPLFSLIMASVSSIWAKFSNGDYNRGRPGERRRWVPPFAA